MPTHRIAQLFLRLSGKGSAEAKVELREEETMEPTDLRYHQEHEWVRVEGKQATLGISNFAQDALGDMVRVGACRVLDRLDLHARGPPVDAPVIDLNLKVLIVEIYLTEL